MKKLTLIVLVQLTSVVCLNAQQWLGSASSTGLAYRSDKIRVGYGPLFLDWTYQQNWNGNAQSWAGYVGFNAYRGNNEVKDMYYGENQYTSKLAFEGSNAGFRWLYRAPLGNDSNLQHLLSELMVLGSDGRLGIGTPGPDHTLQVHSANSPSIGVGKFNQNTGGKSYIKLNAGDGTAANSFFIDFYKTTTTDRLAFVDGGLIERLTVPNGGNIQVRRNSGGTALSILENPISTVGAHFVSEGANNIKFQLKRTADGVVNTELQTAGNSFINAISGNVGIGTTNPDARLAVNGTIHTKEVKVDMNNWSDYVFNKDYKLRSLSDVQQYIEENHHLPDVPSEKEVLANGQNLGEMNAILLKKIEELTLYQIELQNNLRTKDQQLAELFERVQNLEKNKP